MLLELFKNNGQFWVTRDNGFVRTSCDSDVAVFNDDEIVSGSRRRVRKLIAFIYFCAHDRHLCRTFHHNWQRSAARASRHHYESARLTWATQNTSHWRSYVAKLPCASMKIVKGLSTSSLANSVNNKWNHKALPNSV